MRESFWMTLGPALWFSLVSLAGAAPAVVQLGLQADEVVQVPTHPSLAVLLEFPSPITDYAGRGFTEEPGVVGGEFFLRWVAGDSYLAVSPLLEGARGVLHVVLGSKSYAVAFFPAPAEQAWAKVTFALPPARLESEGAPKVEEAKVTRHRRPQPRTYPTQRVGKVWGMMDLMRLARRMPDHQRVRLLQANPALSYRSLHTVVEVAHGRIHLQAAMRNEILDTLVLAFQLENTGADARSWRLESLRVRVGEHLFEPLLTDLEPHVPARGRIDGLLVLAGDGAGERHRLAVDNDFRVSLAEAEPDETRARPAP